MRALDLAGKVFADLTVLEEAGRDKHGAIMWTARCKCGVVIRETGSVLKQGRKLSCPSCSVRRVAAARTVHGMTGTTLHMRWKNMLARTTNPRNPAWHNYGGRGIKVCDRWQVFTNFLEDMGPSFSAGLELDRINVNGNYEPTNCRWVTRAQQNRNKRDNHVIEWDGCRLPLADWGDRQGIRPLTILSRLRNGWTVERALTEPVGTVTGRFQPGSNRQP